MSPPAIRTALQVTIVIVVVALTLATTLLAPVVQPADFPTYAKISSDLGWAPVSQWHYDHGLRPLLARLAASALAEHHRVDMATNPARAASLIGEEIWPHIDPSRPASFDSKAPGADLPTLTRIVDRLEQL